MNKKRVALALAAALGINSLMVTVGTVGRQAVIAHAQDSRLSADLAAKLDALQIKYLETSVEVTTNGNAEVTFKNLDFNNVNKIDAGTFAHKIFDERVNIETNGNGATGAWDSTTKKLTVSGMTDPGIYTGDVTVTYKDNSTEKYTLSLVKKPSDTISFDTDITTGQLVVKNLKFNNGSKDITTFNPEKVTAYIGTDATKGFDLTKDTTTGNYTVSLLKLGKNGNLDLNDTIKVDVTYGNGQYTLTSDIILFEDQNSSIKGVTATNDSTNMGTLADTIKTDFGEATAPTLPTHEKDKSSYGIQLGSAPLLTYVQTVMEETTGNTAKVGGAKLKIDPTTGKEVTVTVESAKLANDATALEDNFVPTPEASYGFVAPQAGGNATTSATALIGKHSFNIDGHGSAVYFDAFSGVTVAATTSVPGGGTTTYAYVDIQNGKTDFIGIDVNAQVKLNVDSFKHGYQAIPVIFEYNDTDDKAKVESGNQSLDAGATQVKSEFTPGLASTVKTSLIISTDKIDGAAVQASFVKTSSSEGQITIPGGTELLTKFVGSADYTKALLTVDGGKATVNSTKSNGKDLVFDVQFNGQVPNNNDADWTLKIGDKTATGEVDLTGGAVESVNLTSVKATNQGMENITDQFKVDASFGTTVPTGGKVTVDTITSDRVTFDQFKEGSHAINNVVGTGKYQGTYSAGVIVSNQPITIYIDEYGTTSSSVTLEIDADFFGNATTGVKAAYISYREAGTNNPYKELDLAIPQDIKDGVITKVVSGLKANTKYEFVAVYTYNETNDPLNNDTIESNVLTVTTKPTSSNSGTISGGSSGSSSSTSSTTVNVTGTNSTTGSNSISVTLPSGTYHHESNSNPSIAGFKYKDKDGKTVTETNDQYSNVKVRFENGRVVVDGLVPGKDYVEISINYNDRNNRTRTLFLKNVKINATNEGQSYLANVYNVVFNRPADENGYMFHLDNLSNKRVSLRAFLLNMINEREFEKIYTTAETKVEALYNAIVNRDSDTQGKAFWVEEYKKLLAVYGSATATLQAIADRMVNETELKNLAQKINFEW
ncbi:DUF4214 domain-containing protein [Candidatus Arthromitus sp. SFB-rat-Yit]|uniref:DUF4214 domain-containing protein n=1 Tax=Candidatus Arthromitus sp. SFB-rat-Yit TaxID=1041504 RepID=UPI000227A585|nr:DUF4214 domain-containing protein [Candidatus Arthromitus sp. SFB-rat-Yit]BAK81633.1 hypothetical protein RATSFB_1071 [Candidatus Arthromitus sp. SFB-rat-Yit]